MDTQRLKQAYEHLQSLDDRLTYRLRPRGGTFTRAGVDQLEEKMKDLASYTIELKEVVNEIILALAARPRATAAPPNRPAAE